MRTQGRRGNAMIEMVLLAPWVFFLFVGVFDFGYYAYALISVENAARVAVLQTAQSLDAAANPIATAVACQAASRELGVMPNAGSFAADCTDLPLTVTASQVTGPDSQPASQVAVTYQTMPMIPIPGLLMGKMTVTRTVQMRVKGT